MLARYEHLARFSYPHFRQIQNFLLLECYVCWLLAVRSLFILFRAEEEEDSGLKVTTVQSWCRAWPHLSLTVRVRAEVLFECFTSVYLYNDAISAYYFAGV